MNPQVTRIRIRPHVLALGVIAGVLMTVPWAGRRLRELELARAAPTLDPDVRRHLAFDSDRRWLAYCAKEQPDLGMANIALLKGLYVADFPRFERNRRPVETALARVARARAELQGSDAMERHVRRAMALPVRADFELRQVEGRFFALGSDTTLTPEARIRELDALSRHFLAVGDSNRALAPAVTAQQCELERGRADLYGARLRGTIALARLVREHEMLCQLLGELGFAHRMAGREDSMRACYDEGIQVARRYHIADQAARLLKFYASFYADRGQLAVAFDRLAEAMRLADESGGLARMQVEYADFFARLECWDLVERSLRRLPPLLRKVSAPDASAFRVRYDFDSRLLLARLAFENGQIEEGNRRMQSLCECAPRTARRTGLADLFDEWSRELEKARRTKEALAICQRGLAHCDSVYAPEHVNLFRLRTARLEASLGHLKTAEALLDSVQAGQPPNRRTWGLTELEAGVLRARLSFLAGRRALARRQIELLYHDFRARWRDPDGKALGNLEPTGAGVLRDAIHEIERFGPAEGYRFEMEWRTLTMRGPPSPAAYGRCGAEPKSAARVPAGTHLVFRFTGDALIRWVADARGVVADTIPLSAERCLVEVRQTLDLLQTEMPTGGAFWGPESFARVRELSELLLPRTLLVASDRPTPVDITPDGPLAALPFEALPFPPTTGAPPLAMTADVAYVRGSRDVSSADDGPVVVVSNPRVPEDLALRYGGLSRLDESDAEARDALKRWPRATLLSGTEATKDSLRQLWPGATVIYLAAHHVRDPGAPVLGFVPLAAPPGAPPDAALLESADIRGLDLSACRLAVLASCSSGAPYRTAVRPGPGLGDAFLDAGAATVVRSFWDVGDAEARDFMRHFLAHWRADEPDAVSLGLARRELMQDPRGRSPRAWAVWSVLTRQSEASDTPPLRAAR